MNALNSFLFEKSFSKRYLDGGYLFKGELGYEDIPASFSNFSQAILIVATVYQHNVNY